MDVTVSMTAEEFREFMDWKACKEKYDAEIVKARQAPEVITTALRFAVEPIEGKKDRYKIISQEHMADLWSLTDEYKSEKTTCARC